MKRTLSAPSNQYFTEASFTKAAENTYSALCLNSSDWHKKIWRIRNQFHEDVGYVGTRKEVAIWIRTQKAIDYLTSRGFTVKAP